MRQTICSITCWFSNRDYNLAYFFLCTALLKPPPDSLVTHTRDVHTILQMQGMLTRQPGKLPLPLPSSKWERQKENSMGDLHFDPIPWLHPCSTAEPLQGSVPPPSVPTQAFVRWKERFCPWPLCFISLICGPEGRYYFFSKKTKQKKHYKRKAHYINGCFEKLQEAIGVCDQASTDLENITQQFSSLPKMDGGGEVNEMRGERDLCPPHEWVYTIRSSVFPLSLYTAKTFFIISFCSILQKNKLILWC